MLWQASVQTTNLASHNYVLSTIERLNNNSKLNNNVRLTGPLPSQWGDMIHLTKLDLRDSENIVGDVPEQVYALTEAGKLKDLVIAGTKLTLKTPTGTRSCADGLQLYLPHLYRNANNNMDAVTQVWCGNEALGSSIPRSIGLYTALKALNLEVAGVTGTLPMEVGLLSNLELIHLEGNPELSGTLPAQWAKLDKLRRLVLNNNPGLKGTLPSQWNGMSALTRLELNDGDFSGSLPSRWNGMSELTYLNLGSNSGLSGPLPAAWSDMNSLVEL
jgi:hypothetical protein